MRIEAIHKLFVKYHDRLVGAPKPNAGGQNGTQ